MRNDIEWDKASTDGKETYWWIEKGKGKRIIKKYTPALAALVSKRTGWIIKPINESED